MRLAIRGAFALRTNIIHRNGGYCKTLQPLWPPILKFKGLPAATEPSVTAT